MIYMQYFCKNSECNAIWLDEDVPGALTPQKWKYCSRCVESGLKNPSEKPKSDTNRGINLIRTQRGKKGHET